LQYFLFANSQDEENQKNLLVSQKEEFTTKLSELESCLKIRSEMTSSLELEVNTLKLQNSDMKVIQEKIVSEMKKNDEDYLLTIRKMEEELNNSDKQYRVIDSFLHSHI
jgi:hypothetical protein